MMQDEKYLFSTRSNIVSLKTPNKDCAYISAIGAKNLPMLLGTETHNPLNYEDQKFSPSSFDVGSAAGFSKRAAAASLLVQPVPCCNKPTSTACSSLQQAY